MSGHLDAIVSLQMTLTEKAAADRRLNSIPDWMQELHEEYSTQKAEIDAIEEEGAAADQVRREAEGALSDAEEQQKRYQEQLGRVSTQREYGALLKEIDTAKTKASENEQAAIEAVESKEQTDAKLTDLREAFRELDERYHAELKKWEDEKPTVVNTLKDLTVRAEELRASVPRNFLVLFERVFKHNNGEALSRVEKMNVARGNPMWHCNACSYNVRPQVVVEIRDQGSLNQCDSCKRILYLEEND